MHIEDISSTVGKVLPALFKKNLTSKNCSFLADKVHSVFTVLFQKQFYQFAVSFYYQFTFILNITNLPELKKFS